MDDLSKRIARLSPQRRDLLLRRLGQPRPPADAPPEVCDPAAPAAPRPATVEVPAATAAGRELPVVAQREINVLLSYAFPLCIMLADPRLGPWYHQHYLQIYASDFRRADGQQFIELYYQDEFAYRTVLNETHLSAALLRRCPDIIELICDSIDDGAYLVLQLDEFYLPGKAEHQRSHFIHDTLIYGYDRARQIVKGVGFNAEWIFTTQEFPFAAIDTAFRSAAEQLRGSELTQVMLLKPALTALRAVMPFAGDYPFDLASWLQQLRSYLQSSGNHGEYRFRNSWWPSTQGGGAWDITFGVSAYDQLLLLLRRFARSDLEAVADMGWNYKGVHFVAERAHKLASSLQFIAVRYGLAAELEPQLASYRQLAGRFEQARLAMLHFFFKQRDRAIVEDVIETIGQASADEVALLTAIERRLRREVGAAAPNDER